MKLIYPNRSLSEYESQVIQNATRKYDFLVTSSQPITHKNFAERIKICFGSDMNAPLNEIVKILEKV